MITCINFVIGEFFIIVTTTTITGCCQQLLYYHCRNYYDLFIVVVIIDIIYADIIAFNIVISSVITSYSHASLPVYGDTNAFVNAPIAIVINSPLVNCALINTSIIIINS